jgi:membrane protein DedA with SNARE-associated domain
MTPFLTDAGYWALIIFAFVQACCIPISSEITFGFAGVLAYEGHLSLPLVIIIGTLAELAGSSAAYSLGRLGGRHTVERSSRWCGPSPGWWLASWRCRSSPSRPSTWSERLSGQPRSR